MREFNKVKANLIHGEKYNYDLVVYKNVDTKVKISCPIHGLFEQTPYHHINRGCGCLKCKGDKIRLSKRGSWDSFIEKANLVHGTRYTYEVQDFKNAHSKINILCPIHGNFETNFSNHVYGKNGCPNCGYNVSRQETEWLESLNIKELQKQKCLMINGKRFKVDGFDPATNTIYEFLGYFWHGHPDFFRAEEINPRNKISFGELYKKTLEKLKFLEDAGYKVVTQWG